MKARQRKPQVRAPRVAAMQVVVALVRQAADPCEGRQARFRDVSQANQERTQQPEAHRARPRNRNCVQKHWATVSLEDEKRVLRYALDLLELKPT